MDENCRELWLSIPDGRENSELLQPGYPSNASKRLCVQATKRFPPILCNFVAIIFSRQICVPPQGRVNDTRITGILFRYTRQSKKRLIKIERLILKVCTCLYTFH